MTLAVFVFVNSISPAYTEDSDPIVIYEEDFENVIDNESYTESNNDDDTVKTLYKDGAEQWTLVKSSGTFTADSMILDNSGGSESSGYVNKSIILKPPGSTMQGLLAYHNLPSALNSGIVTVEYDIRKLAASAALSMFFYDSPITDPLSLPNPIAHVNLESNSSSSTRSGYLYNYIDALTRGSTTWISGDSYQSGKTWWRFKFEFNLDDQTLTILYNNSNASGTWTESPVKDLNFTAIGEAGSYTMAKGFGAIAFRQKVGSSASNHGTLSLDNVKITYQPTIATLPVASNVTISGKPLVEETLTGTYGTYFDASGNAESGSIYEWITADDNEFTTNITVAETGAAQQGGTYTYMLKSDDADKFIKFSITPKSSAAENNVGEAVSAVLEGKIRQPQTIPVTTLTYPQDGAQIRQGAKVTLTASAQCDNSVIEKIEYFVSDSEEVVLWSGESSEQPFSVEWTANETGAYRIYAKAHNDLDETGDSAVASVNVYYPEIVKDPETGYEILFEDDFESGTYTVSLGVEPAGNHYRQIFKDGKLHWTFAKSGTDAFSETFPETIEDFIADDSIENSSNGSKYLTLNERQPNDAIKVWHNLDKTITNGIVQMDIRILHAGVTSTDYPLSVSLYDAPFENFSTVPNKVFELRFTRVSAGHRLRYPWNWKSDTTRGDEQGITCSSDPSINQWIDFKIGVNLDSKKVDIQMRPKNALEYEPYNTNNAGYKLEFYANSSTDTKSTTGNFVRANGVAALAFDGAGNGRMKAFSNYNMSIDDVKIIHQPTIINFFKEDGEIPFDGILTGNSKIFAKTVAVNNERASLPVVLLIAAHDINNTLLNIGLSEAVQLEVENTVMLTAELPVTDAMLEEAVKISAYLWNSEDLRPLSKITEEPLVTDIIGDSELDVYILMGQSNMSGRATIASSESGIIEQAYLLNNQNRWMPASQPLNKYSVLGDTAGQMAMGPGYTFSKTLINNLDENVKLGLVVNAKGGSSISQWLKGQFFYENTIAKAKEAQKYGTIKGIIWHQGCSDSSSASRALYMSRLSQLVSDLRTDLGDETIPFIAGQLAYTSEDKIAFNEMIASISTEIPNSSYVSAVDLTTSDGTHFDAASQRILGKRYAKEALYMIYGIDINVE